MSHSMVCGGVEKSLLSLLSSIEGYEIDLLLTHRAGSLLDNVPERVNVKQVPLTPGGRYEWEYGSKKYLVALMASFRWFSALRQLFFQGVYLRYLVPKAERKIRWFMDVLAPHATADWPNYDIAIIKINQDHYSNVNFHHYILEDNTNIQLNPSDTLSIIGFPFGLKSQGLLPIWITGFLASDYDIDYDKLPCFLIDSRTRKGQSGSPVIIARHDGQYIDKNGNFTITGTSKICFFGIYTGRINKDSDIGYVWKTKAIKEIINSS